MTELNNVACVTVLIGPVFDKLHPPPFIENCFVFSNRMDLKNKIENQGWKFVFLDYPLSSDFRLNSYLTKGVKFLKLIDRIILKYDFILYFDHKNKLTIRHIEIMMNIFNSSKKPIILRRTSRLNIWAEFDRSMDFFRYRQSITNLREYLLDSFYKRGFQENVNVCNTGIIFYNLRDERIYNFLENIYNGLEKTESPQCQIVWSVESQKYRSIIHEIDWSVLDINPMVPASSYYERFKRYLFRKSL